MQTNSSIDKVYGTKDDGKMTVTSMNEKLQSNTGENAVESQMVASSKNSYT